MRIAMLSALILIVAACAPAATPTFETTEGARTFSLLVDGTPAVRAGEAHRIDTAAFSVEATLEHDRVLLDLTNHTGDVLRVHPDRSRFVLTDGSTSAVATGATSWETRDDPQDPVEIPTGETSIFTLIPRENLAWDDELVISPLFPWPLTELVTLRVVLGVDLAGASEEIVLIFTGRPD